MLAFARWVYRLLPANPIAVRLVQSGSRRTRHAIIRSAYLASLIVVLLAILLAKQGAATSDFRAIAQGGAQAFEIVAYVQLALICVLAPVFMAGAIATEANPRTWEVMLTTPLSALQIVLGQLLGRLFFIFALLLCSLPLFAITQYFGGVPGTSVLLSYIVSGGAAAIVGAIAIALAVNRLAGRRAVFAFYICVVSYLGVTLAIDLFLQAPAAGPARTTVMTPINPFLALRSLLSPSTYVGPDPVELQQMNPILRLWMGSPVLVWSLISIGGSAFLMIASAINVRATTSRVKGGSAKLGAAGERFRDARTVSRNPIAWREAAARQSTLPKIILRWSFIGAGALFGIALVVLFHAGTLDIKGFQLALLATVLTQLAVIMLIAINISATAVSREREDGTLDLLLTTPITPADYLGGKLRGVITYLLPMLAVPLGTVAIAAGYVFVGGLGRQGGVTYTANLVNAARIELPTILPEAAILLPIITIAFAAFVVMVGIQWSLKSRGTITSVVAAFAIVASVGGTLGACGFFLAQQVELLGPAATAATPATLLFALVSPAEALRDAIANPSDLASARFAFAVGTVLLAGIYIGITLILRSAMTNAFDTTTRKLAGNK